MRRREPGDLRIDLVAPVFKLALGPFSSDLFAQWAGQPLQEILEPILIAQPSRRPSAAGTSVEVYPLAVPDRGGVNLTLGAFGELGLANDRGLLVVTCPRVAAGYLLPRFGDSLQHGPVEVPSRDGGSIVVQSWLALQRGSAIGIPLGFLGELSLTLPQERS